MFSEYVRLHDLYAMLTKRSLRLPFPKATDREAWGAIAEGYREMVLDAGARQQTEPYPALLATQFLAFCREGSRIAYEAPYFQRRQKLMRTVLAECVRYGGHYLDSIVDGIWLICEESFWGISAHNGSDHPGARPACERPLPDVQNPFIDLFAAQTAALLSWTCHLLDGALDHVTPLIIRRVEMETRRRILTPFLQHDDFWWMGMIRQDVNNWTPWILSNVIACLLIWERDDRLLAEGLARAMRMLDAYLAVLPEDGGCDEGVAYWNMAGGSLLDCLELLFVATGGRVCFYDQPLIQKIGNFPLAAHIAGPYYWNFADCDAKPHLDGERLYCYGARTENPGLMALGASIAADKDVFGQGTPEISRVLWRLFDPVHAVNAPEERLDVTLPRLQVWARERDYIYLAIKGGHNGENHNHNDVGSFLVYVSGNPAIVDIGNITYTAKTFSPERYELFNTRSQNHNVAMIGEYEQAPGRTFRASDMRFEEQAASVDISCAYPNEAGVTRYVRTVAWSARWRITDEIELTAALPVTWVFIVRERPVLSSGRACFCGLEMCWNTALCAEVEEMPVTDARLAKSFPGSLWRLTLTSLAATIHQETFTMHLANVSSTETMG